MPHKSKNRPRHDLKGRIRISGYSITRFARTHSFKRSTVYAVLDGRRVTGPQALKIIDKISGMPLVK